MAATMAGASALVDSLSAAELELLSSEAVPGLADAVGEGFQVALTEVAATGAVASAVGTLAKALEAVGLNLADAASSDIKVKQPFWCGFEAISLHWETALEQTPWSSSQLTAQSVEWCLRQGLHGTPTLVPSSTCTIAAIELAQIGVGMGMMSDMQRVAITWSEPAPGAAAAEGLPTSLIAKLTPANPAVRNRLRASELSKMEALFYGHFTPTLAASLEVEVSAVYFLQCAGMHPLRPQNSIPHSMIHTMCSCESHAVATSLKTSHWN